MNEFVRELHPRAQVRYVRVDEDTNKVVEERGSTNAAGFLEMSARYVGYRALRDGEDPRLGEDYLPGQTQD